MQNSKKITIRAFAALTVLTVIWGYNWVVMKSALAYSGAFEFAALRTVIGALCLFAVVVYMRKPLRVKEMPTLILLGIMQTSGFTGLLIWALVEGGAGKTAVLTYTMPFWVMVLAWPMLGEKLRGLQWPAAILSTMGMLFILDPLHLGTDTFSMFLAVLSGVFWALSVILAKKLHQRSPDLDLLTLTAWQMLFGSIPLAVVALLVPSQPIQWTPYFIGAVIFNSVFCNALAWLLWLYALQRLSAGVASMSSMLAPVIGVLAAWVQLDEVPSTTELIGMTLIAASLLIISMISIRKHTPIDPAMAQD
ncbi:DMT family transporter [Methylotenera sp. G11]|uniref:DMT family transporter n=1 Tax=Methylotenera sp. G11 TaxID=1506585 RepID=UPI000646AD5B|nr:DMT family transporter [Methylotenera sp. G11]